MFKIFAKSRQSKLLYDALDEALKMLERTERMLAVAWTFPAAEEDIFQQVEKQDEEVDMAERLVRRLILEHLAINPERDLPASLALLSVVHEIERLGDYAQSLLELNQWHRLCAGEGYYAEQCAEIHRMIVPLFSQTRQALQESDKALATEVMQRHIKTKKRTDQVLETVMKETQVGRDTLVFVLAVRLLRRMSAHLSNVASSVANPLDLVGREPV